MSHQMKPIKIMVFRKSSTLAATETTGQSQEAATAIKPNLSELIDRYELELQSVLTEKMELSDANDIPAEIRDGLSDVAELIGYDGYDPNGCSLVFVVTERGNKYLSRPSVYAYEDSICIRWGKQTFALPADQALNTDVFTLVPVESPLLLIDPAGYNLACPVKLDGVYRTESFRPQLATKLATCRAAEQLSMYLLRGEPRVSWSDVDDEATIEFYQIQWSPGRKDPSRQVGSILGTLNGSPTLFWAPGEIHEWQGIPLTDKIGDAVIAIKSDKELTVGNTTFQLKGGSYARLKDLTVGKSYQVVGYSSETKTSRTGSPWVDWKLQVIIDGVEKLVSGNDFLKKYLSKKLPDISADKPATLHIDAIKDLSKSTKNGAQVSDDKANDDKSNNGRAKVICRLELFDSGNEDGLLAKLKARQAAQSAQAETAPAL